MTNSNQNKSRADLILEAYPTIQYVAIIDFSNKVIECRGHGTFSLDLSPEKIREFVSIGPLLVMGALGHKLESSCGRLGFVVGRFEKGLVVISQVGTEMVVLVTSIVDIDNLDEIATFLDKLEEKVLA
ncbi:MAG: hypothetical protein ABSA92_08665 [Candidatus Bathyarchaeia archaeon]